MQHCDGCILSLLGNDLCMSPEQSAHYNWNQGHTKGLRRTNALSLSFLTNSGSSAIREAVPSKGQVTVYSGSAIWDGHQIYLNFSGQL